MIVKILTRSSILLLLAFSACAPRRDLVYFSNMASATAANDIQNQEVHIRPNDVISVSMNSLSPESNSLFANSKNAPSGSSLTQEGFRVNKAGNVHLPLIGDFKIDGMTIEEAQEGIAGALSHYVKSPAVEVQLINFKITVIGEVNKPSTFTITDEKVNLLEALGMAGDMTVYGKRENVLIIRTEDNHKVMKRLNLNKEETLNSPYFNLRQNDIVYVEPDRSKALEFSSNTRILPIVIASISAAAVLAAVLLRR
ncbi:polysaccharide biosynthesis/export family protein [Mucilaginibacter sp. SP1R1]|uniref:polysaccharide biosynthesis/export family protein n=1 Tax=Mucilaginibacter sp. SP1R1 TaxID=2723091 RepID=UPI00160AB915|nr:polysaccharide biosynthesis/export family protein [Mucilaginibacter sp. SP1R1]MBB6151128.1 polysaccharide export outer membrane protein [Mucilaginibacter sp. SP1R1]